VGYRLAELFGLGWLDMISNNRDEGTSKGSRVAIHLQRKHRIFEQSWNHIQAQTLKGFTHAQSRPKDLVL